MLKEGERDHCHERMAVKALPGSSLEVVEAEFLFQLLMGLLANPSRLDGGGQGSQAGRSRQVGEIVFLLSRRPVFADKPGLVSRQMLLTLVPDPLRWSVGGAYTDSGKAGFELPPSSRFASSQFAIWHRPACLRPPSIEYLGRAADGGGRAQQLARSAARRQGRP